MLDPMNWKPIFVGEERGSKATFFRPTGADAEPDDVIHEIVVTEIGDLESPMYFPRVEVSAPGLRVKWRKPANALPCLSEAEALIEGVLALEDILTAKEAFSRALESSPSLSEWEVQP